MVTDAQVEVMHGQASELAGGLDDFGDSDYREPLQLLLLSDHAEHAGLSEIGQQLIGGGLVNELAGRLHEEAGFKEHAGNLDEPIEDPIFVVGMARTGTTFIQRLLSADPAAQGVAFWLGNKPMRRPPREEREANPFYQQAPAAACSTSVRSTATPR